MTNREQLLYILKVQRLQEILVLKDDIHLQYKYKNINRATSQASTFQDKIIDAVIEDAVTGTSDSISSSTIKNNVENIIDTNLRNDTKRISYGIPDKAVNAAVSNISNRYQFILGNRIREEIPNLQGKIEDYINSKNLGNLSEADLRETLKDQYGEHAQKRIQNIIRDSFHTNECNLSWVKAVYDGYQYKSWNNGRTKRTRVWHKAKFIQSVPIDETFDIYGSYPARMMYPGDLNGGAENVANCKCWLSYSNRPPSDLRGTGKKTTTKSSKSSKPKNKGLINKVKDILKKPINLIKPDNRISPKNRDESFHSKESGDLIEKIDWTPIIEEKIPDYWDDTSKKLLIAFESERDKITNGKEWAQVYNVTNGFFYGITGGKEPDKVNPLKEIDSGDDELIVIHNHTTDSLFSNRDILTSLETKKNVVEIILVTPNTVSSIKPRKPTKSIDNKTSLKIDTKMNETYANNWILGFMGEYSSWEEAYDGMWDDFIKDELLNKYIEKWSRFKK